MTKKVPDGMHILSVRIPKPLMQAAEAAAAQDLVSTSDVVRMTLARALRDRGLMAEKTA